MSTARYGDGSLYGTVGLTYGTATVNRRLTWGVLVDWDNDGVFTGENEANGRLLSLRSRMGREFVFNSSGDGFVHPDIGNLEITLKNQDGRYDPYNPSTPLLTYLSLNQKVQVILKDESTGTTYYEFTGKIRDIRPSYGTVKKATIYVDGKAVDLKKNIRSNTVYTDVQYDTQIQQALTDAGWDGTSSIDTVISDTMPYHWFRGNQALTEINDIADAAFGLFWVDEEGVANYRSRINSDTSTQTITEDDIDYAYEIQIPTPRDILRNKIRVYTRTRQRQNNVEIWRLSDKPQITGTGSPIWATFNYSGSEVPALDVYTPVATTDYTANDAQDGSSTNRTANFTIAMTEFATAAKLTPTNSAGAAYLTLLRLRGDVIATDDYTFSELSDDDSISTYGERNLDIKTDWLQNVNAASEYADILFEKFSTPRPYPRFKFKRSAIGKQYDTALFNLITINFAQRGITGEYLLGYKERSWDVNEPNVIDTVAYLEPILSVAAGSTWVFPTTFPTIFP